MLAVPSGRARRSGIRRMLPGAAIVCLLGGEAAQAAGPAPPPLPAAPTADDHRSPEQLRQEVLERMRALRAWKIVDGLKLDESTSAKLFPILARYDDREMAVATERHEILRDLRAAADAPNPDDARLTAMLNRLVAVRTKQRVIEDDRIRDVRKVLTPQQQARLVLLLPRLEHDFAHWVRDVAGKSSADDGGQ